jgi:hypothetical protein
MRYRNSTLPKSWEAEGWIDLGSDVNWSDYHGMWGRKAPHEPNAWYILRFTNMIDAAGERAAVDMKIRYECSVFRVDLGALPEAKKQAVLESFSFRESWDEAAEEAAIVYGLVGDGCASPLHDEQSWNYPDRVRAAAKREADAIMNDYDKRERLLDKPFNAIGTTAREVGQDDLLAGLRRHAQNPGAEPDPKKDLMLRLQTAPVKRVKQSSLTGECFLIQIYGTAACADCAAKDTPDCGGKEIRKTGKNEKGIEVGRTGL